MDLSDPSYLIDRRDACPTISGFDESNPYILLITDYLSLYFYTLNAIRSTLGYLLTTKLRDTK